MVKILEIYPEYGISGVKRFVTDLYTDNFPYEVKHIGIWFDERLKFEEKEIIAKSDSEKHTLKEKFKKIVEEYKPDLIHLNVYVIDKDLLLFIKEYKEKDDIPVLYTVHSIAALDFSRGEEDKKLFKIKNDNDEIVKDVIEAAKEIASSNLKKWVEDYTEEILKKYKIKNTEENSFRLTVRIYMIALQLKIFELADEIIYNSFHSKKAAEELYGIKRGKVIELGSKMFEEYEKNKEKIEAAVRKWREKYHEPGDILIFYVGRITPSKGIFELIKEFKKLPYKNVYLYLSGKIDKSIKHTLLSEKEDDKRIFLIDEKELPKPFEKDEYIKMACIYKAADLIVYPSYYEPFGLVPIEAIAFEIPVLARNIDNLETFVKEGIALGFNNNLKEKLEEIIKNIQYYKEEAKKIRERAKEKYTVKKMRSEYIEEINELLIKKKIRNPPYEYLFQ